MPNNDNRPVSVGNARAMIEAYDEKVWGGGSLPREVVFAGMSAWANVACEVGDYSQYEVRCVHNMNGAYSSYVIPAQDGSHSVPGETITVSTSQNHHRIVMSDNYNQIHVVYGIR